LISSDFQNDNCARAHGSLLLAHLHLLVMWDGADQMLFMPTLRDKCLINALVIY
jgi:hypothetical protein